MRGYQIFWGETHHNTYQFGVGQTPSLDEICRDGAKYLDFYAMAYYTAYADAFRVGGHNVELAGKQDLVLEKWKDGARLKKEWAEVEAASSGHNRPGEFDLD